MPNTHKPDQKTKAAAQADRFRAMAEELDCDPDEAEFKAKLAQIARQKPKDSQDAPKKDEHE